MSLRRTLIHLCAPYCIWIASCGPIGISLPAPGTAATILVGLPLALILATSGSCITKLLILLILTGAAYAVTGCTLTALERPAHDPAWIVLDEVIGCCWASIGAPPTALVMVTAVLLFRLFDISKIGPVGWAEQIPGAGGILMDDIVAGLCTRGLIYLLFRS